MVARNREPGLAMNVSARFPDWAGLEPDARRKLRETATTRARRLEPRLNAFVEIEELPPPSREGPLGGMPYAAKDIFDVAGMATTCHSRLRIDHRATTDATAIMRLREAGAVLLGKLALHEFATDGPTRDLPWPPALNPWDLDLHPGGSPLAC